MQTNDENVKQEEEEEDDDVPDYSTWELPKLKSNVVVPSVPTTTTIVEEVIDLEDNDDEDDVPNYEEWSYKPPLPIPKQQPSPKPSTPTTAPPPSTTNKYDDFHMILQNRASQLKSKKQQQIKSDSLFDLSSLLDIDSDSEDEEIDNLSYEEWKQRNAKITTDQKSDAMKDAQSVIQLFDQMKNLVEEEPHVEMLPDEHEEFVSESSTYSKHILTLVVAMDVPVNQFEVVF